MRVYSCIVWIPYLRSKLIRWLTLASLSLLVWLGSNYIQRRAAWSETGGCVQMPACALHKEPIFTLFGHFIREEIVFRPFTKSWWLITSHDYCDPVEVQLDKPAQHPLWALSAAQSATDLDSEVSCTSEIDFVDNECFSSQEAVSEEYHPFPDKLPHHAAKLAARCALEDDECALAEPPRRPRCVFIDDRAEESVDHVDADHQFLDVDADNLDADNTNARVAWSVPPTTKSMVIPPKPELAESKITDYFASKRT